MREGVTVAGTGSIRSEPMRQALYGFMREVLDRQAGVGSDACVDEARQRVRSLAARIQTATVSARREVHSPLADGRLWCWACKSYKAPDAFGLDRSQPARGGRSSRCQQCKSEYMRRRWREGMVRREAENEREQIEVA